MCCAAAAARGIRPTPTRHDLQRGTDSELQSAPVWLALNISCLYDSILVGPSLCADVRSFCCAGPVMPPMRGARWMASSWMGANGRLTTPFLRILRNLDGSGPRAVSIVTAARGLAHPQARFTLGQTRPPIPITLIECTRSRAGPHMGCATCACGPGQDASCRRPAAGKMARLLWSMPWLPSLSGLCLWNQVTHPP